MMSCWVSYTLNLPPRCFSTFLIFDTRHCRTSFFIRCIRTPVSPLNGLTVYRLEYRSPEKIRSLIPQAYVLSPNVPDKSRLHRWVQLTVPTLLANILQTIRIRAYTCRCRILFVAWRDSHRESAEISSAYLIIPARHQEVHHYSEYLQAHPLLMRIFYRRCTVSMESLVNRPSRSFRHG